MKYTNPLTGVIPPLVTPLLDADTLDAAGLERLADRVIDGGVHGIFLLGTTGEGPALSKKLQYETVRSGCRFIAGRVPA